MHHNRWHVILLAAATALIAGLLAAAPAVAVSSAGAAGPPGESQRRDPSIVGGTETTAAQHPWLVQITMNGSAFCGGVLIHPRVVLTAAHCLYSVDHLDWWYRLGTMQAFMGRTNTGTGGVELPIASGGFWKDENYGPANPFDHDFGMIVLEAPTSQPQLKLAGADERSLWQAGKPARVAGFGRTGEGGAGSAVLKQLDVSLIADATCGSAGMYGTDFVAARMLCAGIVVGGQGTCQGDSGGPLVVTGHGGVRRVVGLVSWGTKTCALPNRPTVYARVADPAIAAKLQRVVTGIERDFGFPAAQRGISIIGSGAAVSEACTAASAKAKTAAAKAATAKKKVKNAKKALKKAKKKLSKAKGSSATSKAKKKVAKAKKKLKAAKKKSKALKKKSKKAANVAKARC